MSKYLLASCLWRTSSSDGIAHFGSGSNSVQVLFSTCNNVRVTYYLNNNCATSFVEFTSQFFLLMGFSKVSSWGVFMIFVVLETVFLERSLVLHSDWCIKHIWKKLGNRFQSTEPVNRCGCISRFRQFTWNWILNVEDRREDAALSFAINSLCRVHSAIAYVLFCVFAYYLSQGDVTVWYNLVIIHFIAHLANLGSHNRIRTPTKCLLRNSICSGCGGTIHSHKTVVAQGKVHQMDLLNCTVACY